MDVRNLVKRIIVGWIILVALVALFGRVTVAETNGGTTAANFLLIGAGARPAGMAGAFTAVSRGAEASYWNPAGLTSVEQCEVLLSHFVWYQDMTLEYGAFAHQLGHNAALAASITYFNYGTIQGYDLEGNPTSEISAYDLAAGLSLGYRTSENLSIGLTTKYITQKLDDISGSTVAFDFGANLVNDRFAIAAVLGNVGPKISFEGVAEKLPTLARLGFSYHPVAERLVTAIELEKRFGGATVIRNGLEFNYDEQYYIRTGYNYYPGVDSRAFGAGFSAGLGLRMASYEFDYAYTFGEKYTSEDLHRFTFIVRIGT